MDIQLHNYERPETEVIRADVQLPLATSPLEDPLVGNDYEW